MNTHADLFLAAVLQWLHNNAEHIIRRMDVALKISRPSRDIEWRADTVTDFRGRSLFFESL